MVLAWIHRSISESIAKSIIWIDSATSVVSLIVIFSAFQIFKRISTNFVKVLSVFLTTSPSWKLKVLCDESKFYRHILACSCALPCYCGVISSVQKYHEQDSVIHFLKGLTKKFTHSKSKIMMMSPLPDIDKTFSLVSQQEWEMNNFAFVVAPTSVNNEDNVAFQVQTHSGNYNGKPRNDSFRGKTQGSNGARGHNRICTHRGRTNHTVETCLIKHSFPPRFKGKHKAQNATTHPQPNAIVNATFDSPHQGSNTSSFGFTRE